MLETVKETLKPAVKFIIFIIVYELQGANPTVVGNSIAGSLLVAALVKGERTDVRAVVQQHPDPHLVTK